MPHVVVLTGAGISAESGISTFRDSQGLWADHRIEDVATPEGWERDPERVLAFYNARRDEIRAAEPNAAHHALARLEESGVRVSIITQNIDNFHERAGSRDVLHLHGDIFKARSSVDSKMLYRLRGDEGIELGDQCDKGYQLRPHVVWFGEPVLLYDTACHIMADADWVLVVGTSLKVMPAAALIDEASDITSKVVIDPNADALVKGTGATPIVGPAATHVPELVDHWIDSKRLSLPSRYQ
ncbi:Sir2 family NAD-dependent protein deacetylase [Larsenimonas suaedae]|uniref:NAD-dependent protein deacylase n=1 Tax=Larsenimonas suaedae TaxID=1851019 RepID=A0ABU1GSU7_9GAMM|nr:Sir2 family NAD-dependent protein deacetylase [Larsenimonas suaedae]MCM2972107.1 NAD-dependent deacylase [Larsenimonas suaedae]MDR5895099.1 Sir2 family NAD-dependent protein deacetylase [Larsenimonas suaedae]